MKRIGVIGLWINLALSLLFAAWGLGIYSNRLDWKAEVKQRADKIMEVQKVRGGAEAALQAATRTLVQDERRRPAMLSWYEDRIESLKTGKDNKPVAVPVYSKGEWLYDQNGFPRMGAPQNSSNQPIPG